MAVTLDQRLQLELVPAQMRFTAVISQVVAAELREPYLQWQKGITAAASQFEGYQRTEIYEPLPGKTPEWVTLIHFDDHDKLQSWLNSPQRQQWIDRFHEQFGSFNIRLLGGFGGWFSMQPQSKPVPGWRMVATVVLALYPVLMVLDLALAPAYAVWPKPVVLLASNIASVAILQWLLMPIVTGALQFWLRPLSEIGWTRSIAGLAVIVGILATFLITFSWLGYP